MACLCDNLRAVNPEQVLMFAISGISHYERWHFAA